ncbi:MAG: hypothetical protein ACQKBY_00310 [Verrucomicrobiales bacterium]
MKKPRADAKLKNLPEEDQELFWRMLNPSDAETPASTLEELGEFIIARYDFDTLSLSTLSEWRSWYALKRRMENARRRAEQTRLELLKDGTLTAEDIERAAQAVFTSETLESGNVKAFVALAKLRLAARQVEIDERRVQLLEEKAKRLAEIEGVTTDAKLSAEEKDARVKQIFGIA